MHERTFTHDGSKTEKPRYKKKEGEQIDQMDGLD